MRIKEYTSSNGRNDFRAIYVCTLCGHEFEGRGYSDANFYDNVIPNAICPKCGKNSHGETEEELMARVGSVYWI